MRKIRALLWHNDICWQVVRWTVVWGYEQSARAIGVFFEKSSEGIEFKGGEWAAEGKEVMHGKNRKA